MYQAMNLSHTDAQTMIAAVRKMLETKKKAVAIAVTDSHGELIAFLRMDGCHLPPLCIAVNKRHSRPRGSVSFREWWARRPAARPFP